MYNVKIPNREIEIKETFYCFDRIWIIFKNELKDIKSLLYKIINKSEIEKNCKGYNSHNTKERIKGRIKEFKSYRRGRFLSIIEITAPTVYLLSCLQKFHYQLIENKELLKKIEDGPPYNFAYIEIAKDYIVNSVQDAIDLAAIKYTNLNLSRMNKQDGTYYDDLTNLYDLSDLENLYNFENIDVKKSYPGGHTYYTGGDVTKHAGYARDCKYSGRPCCHGEMRMRSAANIRIRANVDIIPDLIDYDFFKNFYAGVEEDLFRYYEIDMVKLGKWIQIEGNEEEDEELKSKKKLSKDEEKYCLKKAQQFCATYRISNYSDFLSEFRKLKAINYPDAVKQKYSKVEPARFRKEVKR